MHASLQAYFAGSAIIIQRRWRGHHSRQCVHDLCARRAFLQSARRRSQFVLAAAQSDHLAICQCARPQYSISPRSVRRHAVQCDS